MFSISYNEEGKVDGDFVVYWNNGNVYFRALYKNGELTGEVEFKDSDGSLLKKVNYREGRVVGTEGEDTETDGDVENFETESEDTETDESIEENGDVDDSLNSICSDIERKDDNVIVLLNNGNCLNVKYGRKPYSILQPEGWILDLQRVKEIVHFGSDFKNDLVALSIVRSSSFKNIDLDGFSKLTHLLIIKTQLTEIDLSGVPNLEQLDLGSKKLTNIDLSPLPNLKHLTSRWNEELKSISSNSIHNNLEHLELTRNSLQEIDLSPFPKLTYLSLGRNNLKEIDLSHVPKLEKLYLQDNELTNIDLSSVPKLKSLSLTRNKIQEIDLSHVPKLKYLQLDNN